MPEEPRMKLYAEDVYEEGVLEEQLFGVIDAGGNDCGAVRESCLAQFIASSADNLIYLNNQETKMYFKKSEEKKLSVVVRRALNLSELTRLASGIGKIFS